MAQPWQNIIKESGQHMAGLIADYICVLKAQDNILADIFALGEEKREALIEEDLESIKKINNLENTLLSKFAKLDKKATATHADILTVLNISEQAPYSAIYPLLDDKDSKALEAVNLSLKKSSLALKDLNAKNKLLIDSALDYLDFSINLAMAHCVENNGLQPQNPQSTQAPQVKPFLDIVR